jgi:hypothetical protein
VITHGSGISSWLQVLLLAPRRPPHIGNVGKHLVRSPKVFARDGSLVHPLRGLTTVSDVLRCPLERSSWEAFVIDTLIVAVPVAPGSFYGTVAGTE